MHIMLVHLKIIAVDISDPFHKINYDNQYPHVIMEHFTNRFEVVALVNKEAKNCHMYTYQSLDMFPF